MKIAFCALVLVCHWCICGWAQTQRVSKEAASLAFNEILAPDPTALKPSEKLLRLNGQRVRIRGYMAEFEAPTNGYFYLTPRRVRCDESGNGTGELPVESIRVKSAKQPQRQWEHIPAVLEVVGVIAIGNDGTTDEAGNYAATRLTADEIFVVQPARRGATRARKPSPSLSNRRP